MSLSDEQFEFAKDVSKLTQFIESKGDKVTWGEVERPQQLQKLYYYGFRVELPKDKIPYLVKCKQRSKTLYSKHRRKLAVDLNIFIKGKYITRARANKKALQVYGDWWESLNPKNRWGGNWATIKDGKLKGFYDGAHFERNV